MNSTISFIALAALAIGLTLILEAQRFHQHPMFGCELLADHQVPTAWDAWLASPEKVNLLALSLKSAWEQVSKMQMEELNCLNMKTLTIKKMPVVAPRGVHPIRFVGADTETKTSTGEVCNNLVVTVELSNTKDSSGKPFKVSDRYNLDGRGATAFTEDYASWTGIRLTCEQLDEFDVDTLMLNKTAKAEISHRKDGKDLIPVIAKYLPAEIVTE